MSVQEIVAIMGVVVGVIQIALAIVNIYRDSKKKD